MTIVMWDQLKSRRCRYQVDRRNYWRSALIIVFGHAFIFVQSRRGSEALDWSNYDIRYIESKRCSFASLYVVSNECNLPRLAVVADTFAEFRVFYASPCSDVRVQ